MNKRPIIALLFLLSASFMQAQSEEMVKLSEPVLKRAPARAQWTVTFSHDRNNGKEGASKENPEASIGSVPPSPNQLMSLTISKDGKTYQEVSAWGDGRETEKWIVDDLQVYETPYTKRIARAILPTSSQYAPNYSDYRRSDFEELEWIGVDNFKGLKDVDGRKVLEFRVDEAKRRLTPREQSDLRDSSSEQPAGDAAEPAAQVVAARSSGLVAYLDIQTQLPIYFSKGNEVHTYKFSETPQSSLVVPTRFAEELESWKKGLNSRRRLPKP